VKQKREPPFWMCKPYPHKVMTEHGPQDVQINGKFVKLFKVRFYGPRLVGEWGWYQASAFVHSYKEAVEAFHEWVAETKQYIEENA